MPDYTTQPKSPTHTIKVDIIESKTILLKTNEYKISHHSPLKSISGFIINQNSYQKRNEENKILGTSCVRFFIH